MNPEDIARLITEDPDIVDIKCPTCGAHGAYIGFNTIECPNPNCRHYSKKQAFEHQREVMRQESEYRLTPPNIVKALEDQELVTWLTDQNSLRMEIANIMLEDLSIEEEVKQEVRRILRSYKRNIIEGSREWDVMYQKTFEEQMKKRGRMA